MAQNKPDTTTRHCPRCGRDYTEYPALSRLDNATEICSQCGIEEAMEDHTTGSLGDWRHAV